jgi:adenylylsulfate kinase
MKEKLYIIDHNYQVGRADREKINGHKAICLWFVGLSGSGKSTLANYVEQELFNRGMKTFSLDGDNIRKGLNSDLTFTETDRIENLRRIGEVAKLMCDAGMIVTAAFVSPFKKDRQLLRNLMGGSFFEIFVNTPIEVCEQRDVKGLYQKARNGEISNFTGISSPFEAPENPDLLINTVNQTIEQSASLILDYVLPKLTLS